MDELLIRTVVRGFGYSFGFIIDYICDFVFMVRLLFIVILKRFLYFFFLFVN